MEQELPGNVRLNPDAGYVAKIKSALEARGGYCPCRVPKTPENICPCEEFRGQIADPGYEGYCHCRLYYKSASPA